MARKTVVGAEVVRAFARENGITGAFTNEKARGRLPKSLIETYEKETGNVVKTGHKVEQTVTLTVTKVNSKGHKRTRKVERPLSEARTLAGDAAGKRGVFGAKAIAAASEALSKSLSEG